MSAIVGIFGPEPRREVALCEMLAAMRSRGDVPSLTVSNGAALGAAHFDWERSLQAPSGRTIADDGECVVVADATLYYRSDLCRKLQSRAIAPVGSTAAELILAAYRAWGASCVNELEGDFAFVLWDRTKCRVVAGRDPGGKRPLYYAVVETSLLVASTISGLLAHSRCVPQLDPAVLAQTISSFWACGSDTVYAGIQELVSGTALEWTAVTGVRVWRFWDPREIGGSRQGFAEAADHLRQLLSDAVAERLSSDGVTSTWMSGGWDSPSVFAAGQHALGSLGRAHRLLPVSMSYPVGDPGREDETISKIADFWRAPVHWIDVERVPLFSDPAGSAALRDEPFAHTYEHWNRALAQGSRAVGSRVALDGNGGDQLFQVSPVFLSDLFRSGRWRGLRNEWKGMGGGDFRWFFHCAIEPILPSWMLRGVARFPGGAPLRYHLQRSLAPWIRADFARKFDLEERERRAMPRERDLLGWRWESWFYLRAPAFGRIFSNVARFALESGVELRSPLLDRRIVEFALARPRQDRFSNGETKRLLRRSMQGLLPDGVLAPRSKRTGITTAYSHRRLLECFPALLDKSMDDSLLAELGIIDPRRARIAWDEYLRTGSLEIKIALFLTVHAELWLKSRIRGRLGRSRAYVPLAVAV